MFRAVVTAKGNDLLPGGKSDVGYVYIAVHEQFPRRWLYRGAVQAELALSPN
jgi:hypothetical protein